MAREGETVAGQYSCLFLLLSLFCLSIKADCVWFFAMLTDSCIIA